MNYNERLTKPVVLVSVLALLCLSAWVLSAPSVQAQNYVTIFSGPIATSGDCTQRVIFAGQCPASPDNPGTIKLEYRLRLTQPSAKPGEQIGLLLDFRVEGHYSCPTKMDSCSQINQIMFWSLELMFSARTVPAASNGATVTGPFAEFSIDTGGLTTQPLVVQADWMQILGLSDFPQDFQKTGTATTYLTIPGGITPRAFQLQATMRTTPSAVAANYVPSFSWPPTEPVQLIVGPSSQGATVAQQQQNPKSVSGGGTSGFAIPAQTVTTVGEGVVSAAAGIGTGLIGGGLASRFGKADGEEEKGDDWKGPTDETTRTAIDEEAGRIVEDAILHGPKYAQDDFKTLVKAIQGEAEAVGLSTSSAVPPPESPPEPVQQSSGDLIKQLQDSLRAEQDHVQGSPPVVQQTPINLTDPAQVQHALDGFNQSVQSSKDLQNALSTYSGRRVTIQIDDNQSTVQINQNGLSVSSSPADPKNDMIVKLTSDEIKQLQQDMAEIRRLGQSKDLMDQAQCVGSKAGLGLKLLGKLKDGTLANVQPRDIQLAIELAQHLGKVGGSAPK
jgi:hypothetical protein